MGEKTKRGIMMIAGLAVGGFVLYKFGLLSKLGDLLMGRDSGEGSTEKAPTTSISTPRPGETINGTTTYISGIAARNSETNSPVERVHITIRKDIANDGWTASDPVIAELDATVDSSNGWAILSPVLPNANYILQTRVYAADGENRGAIRRFTIAYTGQAPAPTPTPAPTPNAPAPAPNPSPAPAPAPHTLTDTELQALMNADQRFAGIVRSINITTDRWVISYFSTGAYERGGGTGFNALQLDYIEWVAERRLAQLGYTEIAM